METFEEYTVLMLKEEGNTSNACQSYDQDYANHDKAIFWDENAVLC